MIILLEGILKKVNYSEYEGKYEESIKERLEKNPESVDIVHQEYEYIQRVVRLSVLQFVKQSVKKGIDCLELKDYDGSIEKVYFDISRRFDVGYPDKRAT